MALIVLTSAQGSPGVTTTALGLALAWPRPAVLVEADPTGSSAVLAGFFRGEVTPSTGLIDLALSHRQGSLTEDLPQLTMTIPNSTVQLLPGTRSHAQARSLVSVWEPLAGALHALERNGQDVIVDAGRLGLIGSPEPLLHAADLALLVTRSTLPALAGARSWADTLREDFGRAAAAANLGVLVVGQGQPYGTREVRKVLQIPVISTLAWDPVGAEVFSRGAKQPRRFESAPLPRSLRATLAAVQTVLTANRASLVGTPGEEVSHV